MNEDDTVDDAAQSTRRCADSAEDDAGTLAGYHSNDYNDDHDESDTDGDFELLMQDMEAVELGEENATSSKDASSGLLRGFLLRNNDKKHVPSVERNVTSPADNAVPCKGTVVERIDKSSSREKDTTNVHKTQKHVSRFKQSRLFGRDHV